MRYLLTVSILLTSFTAFGQQPLFYYFKNDGRRVIIRDSADFIRTIRRPDSGSVLYNVREFYPNDSKRFIGKSSEQENVVLQGECTWFYPNGNRLFSATYRDGRPLGEASQYYPNGQIYFTKIYPAESVSKQIIGPTDSSYLIKYAADSNGKALVINGNGYFKRYGHRYKLILEEGFIKNGKRDSIWTGIDTLLQLKFTEHYKIGVLKDGQAVDSAGVVTSYITREVLPGFKGGFDGFCSYISHHIVYPRAARQNNVQGKIYITFIIKKDGKISNIKMARGIGSGADEEGMRVLAASPPWIPGFLFGRPADFQFTIPLTFTLTNK